MNSPVAAQSTLERIAFSQRADLSSGQPIGRLMAQALKYPKLVSLAAGFVDNATLPCAAVTRALQQLGDNPERLQKALQYDTAAGSEAFRGALAQWAYRRWPTVRPDASRIILTSGSNQFLHLLAEAILDPGDIVIAAAPTYFVFMGTLRGMGARVVGVHADEHGVDVDAIEQTMHRLRAEGLAERVKAIYIVTDFDNPAGSTLSLERRQRLLTIVERWRAEHGPLLLLSDNAYQELRYDGEHLPPLLGLSSQADEYVIELGTFSKSFSPGIRVGWGVVPEAMVERLLEMKSNMDFGSPHFSQVLMHDLVESNAVDEHLPKICDAYRSKRNAMLSALAREASSLDGVNWRKPAGGLYVWVSLPEHLDTSEKGPVWRLATEKGVLYVPGHYCYPPEGEPIAKNTMRLSFGVQSVDGIDDGVSRLMSAVREVI
jgi:2-aminoadipate transaminase